jgi:hypothetical protein
LAQAPLVDAAGVEFPEGVPEFPPPDMPQPTNNIPAMITDDTVKALLRNISAPWKVELWTYIISISRVWGEVKEAGYVSGLKIKYQ